MSSLLDHDDILSIAEAGGVVRRILVVAGGYLGVSTWICIGLVWLLSEVLPKVQRGYLRSSGQGYQRYLRYERKEEALLPSRLQVGVSRRVS
ncbi:MAG: hypothetical protein M1131_03910 [Actinobacteria bacterium]|nr:hypothetical protein [Actinomycetota bacterium]MCL6094282.1 hypothetical protein [Actinomycetota bacterium]